MSKKKKPHYMHPNLRKRIDNGDYYDTLTAEDKAWIERFDYDMYGGGVYKEGSVIKGEAIKKEARRKHNSLQRDAYEVTETKGFLQFIDVNHEKYRDFMEDASDEWDWKNEYDVNGYKAAVEFITERSVRDAENPELDKRVVLSQYHIKMNNLHRLRRRDKAKGPK